MPPAGDNPLIDLISDHDDNESDRDIPSDGVVDIKAPQIVLFVSTFVMKFQLLYKLSIVTLLKFLKLLLSSLNFVIQNSLLSGIVNIFPVSLYSTRKYAHLNLKCQIVCCVPYLIYFI